MCTNPKKSGQSTGHSRNQSSPGSPHQKGREDQVAQALRKPHLHLLCPAGRPWTHLHVVCSVFMCGGFVQRCRIEQQIQLQGQMKQKMGQAVRYCAGAVQCGLFPRGSHTPHAWSSMQSCQEAQLAASQ